MKDKIPLSKLLDIKSGQYKIAIASIKRVYQIANNEKIRNMIEDSKRVPIIALSEVLNKKVKLIDNTSTSNDKLLED